MPGVWLAAADGNFSQVAAAAEFQAEVAAVDFVAVGSRAAADLVEGRVAVAAVVAWRVAQTVVWQAFPRAVERD